MKRFKILFILVLFVPNLVFGQIDKNNFDKTIDYINCQAVYYYLSVLSSTSGVTAKFTQSCDCNKHPSFDIIYSAIAETEDETKKLSKEIEDLKEKDISNLNEGNIVEYFDDFFEKSDNLKQFKNGLERMSKFEDLKAKIKNKVQETDFTIKASSKPVVETPLVNTHANNNESLKIDNIQESNESWFKGITSQVILTSLFFSLLFFALVFILFNPKRLYKSLIPEILESKRLKDLITQQTGNPKLNKPQGKNVHYEREIEGLQKRINELEGDIKRQNERINEIQSGKSSQILSPSNQKKEESIQKEKLEVFYLSTPNSDGSFNESSVLTSYREGASIYKLFKTAETKANFEIDNRESSIKLAIQYPDRNIDPVCEAESAFNPKSNKIITTQKGTVELQNGKWIVTKKAKISYD